MGSPVTAAVCMPAVATCASGQLCACKHSIGSKSCLCQWHLSHVLGGHSRSTDTCIPAVLQVWAGTKQKELGLNGMQLLHQVSPIAVMLLGVLIPALEPVGWGNAAQGTLLAYKYTLPSL